MRRNGTHPRPTGTTSALAVLLVALCGASTLAAQSPGRRITLALTHSVGSSTSAHPPPCSICSDEDVLSPVSVSSVELELAIPIGAGERSGLEYHLRVVPLAVLQNNPLARATLTTIGWSIPSTTDRGSTLGLGIKPAGLRGWIRIGTLRAEADVSGGLLRFGTPALAGNGANLNFVGEIGVGLRFPWPERGGATLGYRRHHVSNAGLADVNPGLNSHVLVLGIPIS
jgi:hypothetical protein